MNEYEKLFEESIDKSWKKWSINLLHTFLTNKGVKKDYRPKHLIYISCICHILLFFLSTHDFFVVQIINNKQIFLFFAVI